MSVLLPNNVDWGVANWISFGLFHDCLPHLDLAPQLADDIRFCVDAEVDTLDLRTAPPEKLWELHRLVSAVLHDRRTSAENDFADPVALPVYFTRLEELVHLIDVGVSRSLQTETPQSLSEAAVGSSGGRRMRVDSAIRILTAIADGEGDGNEEAGGK